MLFLTAEVAVEVEDFPNTVNRLLLEKKQKNFTPSSLRRGGGGVVKYLLKWL